MRDKSFCQGVINGALFEVVIATMQPGLVLSAFFFKLTDSTFYAALPMTLIYLGGLWPPLIVAHIAEGMARKKPIYIFAGAAPIALLATIATATLLLGDASSTALVALFPLLYFFYSSANAAGRIGFMEMIAKTIPAKRPGHFMGMRGCFGGLFGLATGLYVQHMLGADGPVFPLNYAGLFFTATLFLIPAVIVFAAIDEPRSKLHEQRGAFRDHLRRGMSTLREDRNFRLLVATRLLMAGAIAGQVIFIPYAIKELALPESIVGVLMIIAACFALPSHLIWSHLCATATATPVCCRPSHASSSARRSTPSPPATPRITDQTYRYPQATI